MNWVETIMGSTRAEVLSLLRRERRSVGDLAEALRISDTAVRTHLAGLQRDGMVEVSGYDRRTGGKPSQLYQLTERAEEIFPKAYGTVLNGLLGLLEERFGRKWVIELLRELGVRSAGQVAQGSGGMAGRVEAAADVLRQLGGDVAVEVVEAGGWMIRGYGCPLSGVVSEHEEACALAESLVGTITGAEVAECCDRGDRPRCSFRVEEVGMGVERAGEGGPA